MEAMRPRVAWLALAMCGASSTLGSRSSGLSIGRGSGSVTASAAPPRRPPSRASEMAAWATNCPRAVFTSRAARFIAASSARPSQCRVSALSGTWSETKSDSASSVALSTRTRPSSASSSGRGERLTYSSRIPKPRARRATAAPIFPRPTRPSVAPWTSLPSSRPGSHVFHLPART